jgi:drug/metabolite transporter (DMT)-like permease
MSNFSLTTLLLLVTAVWGWTFTLVKDAVAEYGVVSFLAVRFVIGSLALAPWAAGRLTRRSVLLGGWIGLVLAAAYLFQTFGVHYTTATNCGLITGLFVILALLLNRALYGVRVRRLTWAAVGVSLLGLVLLTGAGPSRPTIGDLLSLGAALGFGLQIVLLDRYAKAHDTLALTLTQLATAAVTFVIIWPVTASVVWPSGSVWSALLVTGLLATAGGFFVQVLVQQRLPAVRAAILFTMEPVFAALFGHLLAGDRLTLGQLAGAALMVGAVLTSELAQVWLRRSVVRPHTPA